MSAAGAQDIVQVSNEDFLDLDIQSPKFGNVSCVLLDPSCSGSGVARALERVIERQGRTDAPKLVDDRLEKLRAFQIAALRKAMSFPAVQYIVYSTCSIHEEENESVIAEVLSSSSVLHTATDQHEQIAEEHSSAESLWSVVEPKRLLKWRRRGQSFPGLPYDQQQKLIRCHPSDGLNGFFVAVLQKKKVSTHNHANNQSKDVDVGVVVPIMKNGDGSDVISQVLKLSTASSSNTIKRKADSISIYTIPGSISAATKRSVLMKKTRSATSRVESSGDRRYCSLWRPFNIYQLC